jgi:hypothetical protein
MAKAKVVAKKPEAKSAKMAKAISKPVVKKGKK